MKKAYLIILDGFGLGHHDKGDAIFNAKKPFIDCLLKTYPVAKLKTHGRAVGLPEFQTGGSEAGHITIGAGRPVKQFLTKINDQINDGSFFENPILIKLFKKAKKNNRIHFFGLTSDGGIHSFLPHLFGLLQMAKDYKIKNTFIHACLDGRDVGERTAKKYLQQIDDQNYGEIASLGGRFFGMDRDKNWDRIKAHYDILCNKNTSSSSENWKEYLNNFYKNSKKSDYYVPPVLFKKTGQINSDDIVIFFDFRADRMQQISSVISDKKFKKFDVKIQIPAENLGVFGKYAPWANQIFSDSKTSIPNTLGELIEKTGEKQLRISESEKYNHVTFYFSGERKKEFKNEKRILVPSPKCASYADLPAMSALEQTNIALSEIKKNDYKLVVQNFANADLVGHSGNYKAAKKSIEVLDNCLKKLVPEVLKKNYELIITADHGNSDEMILDNGEPNASHTKNLVPCILVSKTKKIKKTGTLADIAPTILDLLFLNKPKEMTGKSLIK